MRARILKNIDIGFSYVNLQGRVFDVHEVVGTRVTIKYPCVSGTWNRLLDLSLDEVELLMKVKYRNFNEMSIEELKAEFKLVCAKGITSDIKNRIASDRHKAAKKFNEELHLVSHIGDGFVCIDNILNERGIQDIYGEYKPSRKGAFEVYCDARKLGLKHFTITFQTSYYIYQCIEDKFAGEYPEHSDDGENYDIVEYKAI